jgi:hypothetical protein
MSSKTKKPSSPTAHKPKYEVGQSVFYISYHKGKPEELTEFRIVARTTREYDVKFPGEKTRKEIHFTYEVYSPSLIPGHDIAESLLYPSFFEAAKVFAKAFLKTLK